MGDRHAATAGGGGKKQQAPTPSLFFIPKQKRLTLIPAHSVEGKKLPASDAALTQKTQSSRLLDRKSWQAILFLRRREDKVAREVVREDDD